MARTKAVFVSARVARRLLKQRITERTLYSWAQRGVIPSRRFGRFVEFDRAAIERIAVEGVQLPVNGA